MQPVRHTTPAAFVGTHSLVPPMRAGRRPWRRYPLMALLLCGVLTGCGGGGGDDNLAGAGNAPDPSINTTTPPNHQPEADGLTPGAADSTPTSPVHPIVTPPASPPATGQPSPPVQDADPLSQSPTAARISITGEILGLPAAAQPVRQPLPQSSGIIAYDRQTPPRIWVVNPDQDSVSVLSSQSRQLLREVPLPPVDDTASAPSPETEHGPRTLAIDNAGYVWVTNQYSGSISIIHPLTLQVVTHIQLGAAVQPYGIVAAPDGSGIWVSTLGSQEVLQFDPVSRQLRRRIAVGDNIRHLAISADSRVLLASRFISPPLPGEDTLTPQISGPGVRGAEVLLIDPARGTLLRTISLGVSTLADTAIQGRGLPNYLGAAAIAPDGSAAWIPSKQDNIQRGQQRDGRPLDFQNTVRAILSRVQLQSDHPAEQIERRYDLDNSGIASAAAYTPDGNYILVALESSRELSIINAEKGIQENRVNVQRAPQGVAISPDGTQAAVSNVMSRTISIFDITPLANHEPRHILPPESVRTLAGPDRLPAQILRGKQIFHDARDTRLAHDSYISCSVCHSEGYDDGRIWDMSNLGEGLRRTISLRGHGGKKKRLHWTGNFDEVQDFEQQIRVLGGGSGLMPPGSFEQNGHRLPLGTPKAGESADLDALAAYVNSLSRYAPSPYRNSDRSLTNLAQTGARLFASKGCTTCHQDADLGSDGLTLTDIGTLKPSSGTVQNRPLTGIVTPGLRDAWYTAPYLHDGSAATLEAAIQAHRSAILTAEEVNSLAAYVRQAGNGQ